MSSAWVLAFLAAQRLAELALSRRHVRARLAQGGREFGRDSFRLMAGLHLSWLVALALESFPWRIPLDARTWGCLAALVPVTALRYWSIATLGSRWTVRVVVVPGDRIERTGPYRWLRHPNYLVIVLEFILFPLLLRAPATLAFFSLANLFVLRQRIRIEERALRELTDYDEAFPPAGADFPSSRGKRTRS